MPRTRCSVLAATLLAGWPAAGRAQSAEVPSQGALIVRLGSDTMAAERFSRTARRMEGMLLSRTGGTRLVHYVAELAPSGTVERLGSRRAISCED